MSNYGEELKKQMALKESMKINDKLNDWVADFNHLDTI